LNAYLTAAQSDQKTYGATYLVRQKGISHDAKNGEVALSFDSRFMNVAKRAPAIIQSTGKGGKIMLALHKLAGLVHCLYV